MATETKKERGLERGPSRLHMVASMVLSHFQSSSARTDSSAPAGSSAGEVIDEATRQEINEEKVDDDWILLTETTDAAMAGETADAAGVALESPAPPSPGQKDQNHQSKRAPKRLVRRKRETSNGDPGPSRADRNCSVIDAAFQEALEMSNEMAAHASEEELVQMGPAMKAKGKEPAAVATPVEGLRTVASPVRHVAGHLPGPLADHVRAYPTEGNLERVNEDACDIVSRQKTWDRCVAEKMQLIRMKRLEEARHAELAGALGFGYDAYSPAPSGRSYGPGAVGPAYAAYPGYSQSSVDSRDEMSWGLPVGVPADHPAQGHPPGPSSPYRYR